MTTTIITAIIVIAVFILLALLVNKSNVMQDFTTEEKSALELGDKIAAGEKVAYDDAETSVQYAKAAVEQAVEPTKPYGDNPNCLGGLNGCDCALSEDTVAPATAEQEASPTPVNTETTAPTPVPASGTNP